MPQPPAEAPPKYDPTVDPKHLGPTAQEASDAETRRIEQLDQFEAELRTLNKVEGMFNSAGWKMVETELVGQMNNAARILTGDTITSMEGVAFLRGQIRAFEYLAELGKEAKKRKTLVVREIKRLKAGR